MTRTRRAVLTLMLPLSVAVPIAGCGDSDEPSTPDAPAVTAPTETATTTATTPVEPPAPAVPSISVRGDEPVGGVLKIEVDKGDQVKFTVKSDTAHEVHVHGYDLTKDVPAGGSVTFSFEADIDGAFEVELEGPGVQIASLSVNP